MTNVKIAVFIIGVCAILLALLLNYVLAHGHGYIHPGTSPVIEQNQSSGNGNASGESRRGVANALCLGMTNFDYDRGGQISGGGSWWQDENSACVAYGTMVDDYLIIGGGACDTGFNDCGGAVTFSTHIF